MSTVRWLLFWVAACGVLLIAETAYCGELKDEFYQDFTSSRFPPPSVLRLAQGDGEKKVARLDAAGVRVFVSGTPSGFPPFGVSPRFHVSGDFEITVSYELVKLDKPTAGYGASVSLWAMVDTPSVDAVTLSRAHRRGDGQVHVADKGWWDVSEKKYHHDGKAFPTQTRNGKLRLVRKGAVVHFLVAEGESQEFQELRRLDYSKEDLSQIHLGVDSGGWNGPVEVLLKDLRIRAEELPLAGVTRKQTGRAWLIWLVAGLAGTAAVGAGALFFWKSRRASRKARELEEPTHGSHGHRIHKP